MTSYRWRWDIGRIRQTAVADNVVDLMVQKIERLPAALYYYKTKGNREVKALSEAMREMEFSTGFIIAETGPETIAIDGGTIEVVPAVRFLLGAWGGRVLSDNHKIRSIDFVGRRMWCWLTISMLFAMILLCSSLFASQSIVLDQTTQVYHLGHNLNIFEDSNGNLSFNDILKKEREGRFTMSNSDIPNYGYTKSVYWVSFSINNQCSATREMYLEIAYPLLDEIELYIPLVDNNFQKKIAGDNYVFGTREFDHRNFVFKVLCHPGEWKFFVRIQTTSSMSFPIILQEPSAFTKNAVAEYIILGLYYGILLVMILYNLFIYSSVRDKNYLYYMLYISVYLLTMLSLNGISFQYLWPNNVKWANMSVPFLIFLDVVTLPQFSRVFLGLKKMSPVLNRLMQIMMLLGLLGVCATSILSYSVAIRLANILGSLTVLVSLCAGLWCLYKGYRAARFYMIAWTALLIGVVIFALQNAGILPYNFITKYGHQVGSAAEVVLLSLALADRINIIKQEKEEAQAEALHIQRQATETLEIKVEERTNELASANERLKSLDRAKTEFFANVSHELRTPLTLMLSPVASVLQGAYPGKVDATFFRKLYDNGARLLGLINNLLDFSKIEAGRMTVNAEQVDVSRELELCAANFHSAAQAKGLTLSCEDRAGGVEAHMDRDLFRKAVYNLLGNAIKFTPSGGKIGVALDVGDGSFTVSVSDTGIGIPADKHEIIFERFGQADASSTRKYEGTGIGLSLTREIARLHGGDVTFRSVEGEGSTFYLTMPLNMEAIKGSEPRAEGFIGESEPQVDRESSAEGSEPPICESLDEDAPRVLIVEDNPDMLSFLSEIVGSRYRVIRARNGKEALAAIGEAAEPFDLILTDVMMPEMDGLELLAAVRADAAYEGVPVLLLTAKADDAMKLEGFGKGATDYIVKPFNALELLARIASQLELKEVRDRLARANAVLYRRLSERGASSATVGASAEEKVARVVEFIAENFTADISREGLAAAVDLSPDHLSRAFNRVTGKRIDEHINELRIEEAKRRLRETDETVISIAMGVGFESVRTFNKVFAKLAGMPPTRWREGDCS